jgi:tRNA A-37 threonylcarbamoyl transferase component Bud32
MKKTDERRRTRMEARRVLRLKIQGLEDSLLYCHEPERVRLTMARIETLDGYLARAGGRL